MGARPHRVARPIKLFDADNTLPFKAHYRKQDGLVHVSQMADRYVRNPFEVVRVGDVISVKVISVDHERGRIGLSMRDVG